MDLTAVYEAHAVPVHPDRLFSRSHRIQHYLLRCCVPVLWHSRNTLNRLQCQTPTTTANAYRVRRFTKVSVTTTDRVVLDEYIEHVGYTGLTPQEEITNRERKYSVQGDDVRRFSNPKGAKEGTLDPYYQRRSIPDAMVKGVGETGLTTEQEYENRERKYSATGVDVRRFSNTSTGFLNPSADPYYGRKSVHSKLIHGDLRPMY